MTSQHLIFSTDIEEKNTKMKKVHIEKELCLEKIKYSFFRIRGPGSNFVYIHTPFYTASGNWANIFLHPCTNEYILNKY